MGFLEVANSNRDRAASARAADTDLAKIDRPMPSGVNAAGFGSDVVADALRALDVPYIALNPGASYRGLHDSLVNYLGNERPQMLLCLHEESAVAIAHGYAKVTGKPLAVAVHSNVGLMHASMAVFNAWCDRVPMVILGATGPVDAAKRRPWIDWIHTAADQGALIRGFTKWDDQPASPTAAREAMLRAGWIATTAPRGPTYVNLDAGMQEAKLSRAGGPDRRAALHAGRCGRRAAGGLGASRRSAAQRQAAADPGRPRLARSRGLERARATGRAAQRARHHRSESRRRLPDRSPAACRRPRRHRADARGAGGAARGRCDPQPRLARPRRRHQASRWRLAAKIVQVSLDHRLHNGWSMDYQALPPVDVMLDCEPDLAVPALIEALGAGKPRAVATRESAPFKPAGDKLTVDHLADALRRAVGEKPASLTHVSLSWNGASWPLRHPLDYLGSDGGGGVGGGPGISVGAALALKGSGRLPVAVCGDGDFLMGVTALWTAAHYRIPLLMVIANNRSFFNDELHQERVARMRNRPVENRWVGQRISEPDIDLAAMARAQGAQGFGPVSAIGDLEATFAQAIAAVEAGGVAVVDVRVEPGYSAATTAVMSRKSE